MGASNVNPWDSLNKLLNCLTYTSWSWSHSIEVAIWLARFSSAFYVYLADRHSPIVKQSFIWTSSDLIGQIHINVEFLGLLLVLVLFFLNLSQLFLLLESRSVQGLRESFWSDINIHPQIEYSCCPTRWQDNNLITETTSLHSKNQCPVNIQVISTGWICLCLIQISPSVRIWIKFIWLKGPSRHLSYVVTFNSPNVFFSLFKRMPILSGHFCFFPGSIVNA